MTEAKARKKLQEVSPRWGERASSEQLIGIFRNSEKYTLERQSNILRQFFKPFVPDFDNLSAQFDVDVKKNKKTPYEAFINFLCNMSLRPSKPQIAVKPTSASDSRLLLPTKTDLESPVLSSTRVENCKPDVVVSEVKLNEF